jgi:hypothetical protein
MIGGTLPKSVLRMRENAPRFPEFTEFTGHVVNSFSVSNENPFLAAEGALIMSADKRQLIHYLVP